MRKTINNILKLTAGLCMTVFCVSACTDWTRPESVEIHYPTLEEQNPELYEAYMQLLRDYRSSDHMVTFVKFDNLSTVPAGQSEHLNALPDSVDFVILKNPDNLSESIVSEMNEIRSMKGIKTLYTVSYSDFEASYDVYLEKWEEEHPQPETPDDASEETGDETPENPETPGETPTSFDDFMTAEMDRMLALYDKYPYDGINFLYNGVFSESLPEEDKTEYFASQSLFFSKVEAWIEAHPQSIVTFEGVPFNVANTVKIWDNCDFVIIDAINAVSAEELSQKVRLAISDAVKDSKLVIQVTALSVTNPTDTKGLFTALDEDGNQIRAIIGAAGWTSVYVDDFNKAGICIDNIRNDYFNILKTYKYSREAISIMNPSPLK